MRNFEFINEYAKSLGAKIYNCSYATEIKAFENISLEEALTL